MPPAASESVPSTLAALERGIEAGLHTGGQLYLSLGGEVRADAAFGEVRPAEPMRRDHLMLWLSASKPVAAVAIAQLWERELLALDDRVAEHIPAFAQGGKEAITVRHCLTHTGGFRMLDVGWPRLDDEGVLERICTTRLEPRWQPGRTAGYHRASSWFVLGEVVRRVDGRPFERYVREEIFEPLGMADSWIGMPVERYRAYGDSIAPTFHTVPSEPRRHRWHEEPWVTRCSPGGNGRGPIAELGRFYECLLAGGRIDPQKDDGARLLRPQTVEALVARHRVGLEDKTFRAKLDWGLGFALESSRYGGQSFAYGFGPHASPRAYGHGGFRSVMAFADPEHGLAVAVALNGTPDDVVHGRRMTRIARAIYADLGLARPADGTPGDGDGEGG